jgi:hypothetical protein
MLVYQRVMDYGDHPWLKILELKGGSLQRSSKTTSLTGPNCPNHSPHFLARAACHVLRNLPACKNALSKRQHLCEWRERKTRRTKKSKKPIQRCGEKGPSPNDWLRTPNPNAVAASHLPFPEPLRPWSFGSIWLERSFICKISAINASFMECSLKFDHISWTSDMVSCKQSWSETVIRLIDFDRLIDHKWGELENRLVIKHDNGKPTIYNYTGFSN